MSSSEFLSRLQEILAHFDETQSPALDEASVRMADTIANDGLVHLFGSGHSVIPVLDAFPRYGSFVGLHPVMDPRLMWFRVLGGGGAQGLLWLERTEGYMSHFLATQPIARGDTMVIFSHGGLNAAPVEAAMYVRDKGVFVVGVTSSANLGRPASHSSGKRLADLSDIVIDTGVPVEDALVSVEGWEAPVAGASTIVALVVVGELVSRTAAALVERGITLPTFVSPTVPGASVASNQRVFDAYRRRLLAAEQREITE
jgi:uncharacterized phosphosugar-binding protein